MDSRERTWLTLHHQRADRLPVDFWASASMVARLECEYRLPYETFLDAHDIDLRYIAGPRYSGPPLAPDTDIWGVPRRTVTVGGPHGTERYSEVSAAPLGEAETVAAIEAYPHWPSPDWFDYGPVRAQCEAIRRRGRVAVFMGDRLNRVAQLKPAMYLRGVEALLLDVALRRDLAAAVLDRVRRFYQAYLERILTAADGLIDLVLTGDDFGSQQGLLISPAAWRELLQPGFRQYLDLVHAAGALGMHHTCGSVVEIIPDMVASGLDVLQSIQPEAAGMDAALLQARFGDRLCFHGGLSIQRALPFGSPADVRREVERLVGLFRDRGGYILGTAHNLQTDTPPANVQALLDAYRAAAAR